TSWVPEALESRTLGKARFEHASTSSWRIGLWCARSCLAQRSRITPRLRPPMKQSINCSSCSACLLPTFLEHTLLLTPLRIGSRRTILPSQRPRSRICWLDSTPYWSLFETHRSQVQRHFCLT